MEYFIIIYRVVVDNHTYYGKVGRATKQVNQMLFNTKVAIEEGYANKFPDAFSINVFIVKNRQITLREYMAFVKVAQGHYN